MTIELLFNIILTVFFAYCAVSINSVANLPNSDTMGGALWPQIILVLLVLMLVLNIRGILKKNKEHPEKVKNISVDMVVGFFKSRLFIGILLIAVMSFLLDPLGFIPSVILFLAGYMYLLGLKNPVKLCIYSVLITFFLYFLFSLGLSVMLPRGVGFLRDFHLFLENII